MEDNLEGIDLEMYGEASMSSDEERILDELGIHGAERRQFLGQSLSGARTAATWHFATEEEIAIAMNTEVKVDATV